MAKGQFIAFLDADDLWLPEKLEKQLAYMKQKNLLWSHSSYIKIYEKNKSKIALVNASPYKGNIFPFLLTSCRIATPCVMVDSDLLKSNKQLRFASDVPHGQDIALWMKIALEEPIGVLSEPLALVRIRGDNAALKARVQIEARANFYLFFQKEGIIKKIPEDLLLIYRLLWMLNESLSRLENNILRRQLSDWICKVLYFPFWSFFKFKRLRYIR